MKIISRMGSPTDINMPELETRHQTSPFSPNRTLNGVTAPHNGTDFSRHPLGLGSPIYAPIDGIVIVAHDRDSGSAGKHIAINHGAGLHTRYLHLDTVLVKVGEYVRRGQQIGTMGFTGDVVPKGPGGTHLHFEIRENDGARPVDPLPYLRGTKQIGPRLYIDGQLVLDYAVQLNSGRMFFQQPSLSGKSAWVEARTWSNFLLAFGIIKTAEWDWDQENGVAHLKTK